MRQTFFEPHSCSSSLLRAFLHTTDIYTRKSVLISKVSSEVAVQSSFHFYKWKDDQPASPIGLKEQPTIFRDRKLQALLTLDTSLQKLGSQRRNALAKEKFCEFGIT